ncbi:hypothetical protein Patl1_10238 [Pistacia atlantica]|uniref:Uncharacterized protein n=1 Tax=Pistacia atlantica TaxID=434234 RepID=A0ACC1A3N6_9ROSI|nr:hypothetical protein Patl1_10238 [Pistacia atlantica]
MWSFLHVPSVQELVKEPLTTVHHVRDLTDSELDKLHLACKEWGFFQLINHGVSSSLVQKVKIET